jgi:hypothetical protein
MTNDKKRRRKRLKRMQKVTLKLLPPGLIDGLPEEDQRAITAVVGKPVVLGGYERNGTVKLEFFDKDGAIHLIWVEPKFIKPWRAASVRRHLWYRPTDFNDANKRNASRDGQKKRQKKKLSRGRRVILKPLPPDVIGSLPKEDQQVISAVVGRPIVFFNKYERDGRAELEFIDSEDTAHLIYVDPKFIKPW